MCMYMYVYVIYTYYVVVMEERRMAHAERGSHTYPDRMLTYYADVC